MRRIALLAVLLAAVVGMAGWRVVAERRAVVIGAVYPTGPVQGKGGLEEFRGATLASEYVNRQGGVHGRIIRLKLERADSWDAAPVAVERLAAARAGIVMGSYGSTVSYPAAETAARLGLVFWETGAVGELGMSAAHYDKMFRFAPTGQSLGRAAVAFARDQLTPRLRPRRPLRFTVAYVDDVYGRTVGLGAIAEIQESGLTLAGSLPYRLARVDYDALARAIAQARTDVLVVGAYLGDGVATRRALVRAKVPLLAGIGTSSSYCMPEFGRLLGADAVGLLASDKPDGDVLQADRLSPEAAEALRWGRATYQRRFGHAMTAPALAGFAGGLALFQHVLPAASELSPDAVARAARRVQLPLGALPNGSGLAFGAPGQVDAGTNLRATSVIWQWVRPFTREVVWPPAFATHPIVDPQR